MIMTEEFEFFVYLIEAYAKHKGSTASAILNKLDKVGKTDFVFDMYEMYHSEAIENAFIDIDSLITTGKPAWL